MATPRDSVSFSGPGGSLPGDVHDAFLNILSITLLVIRANSHQGDLCHQLADHAHNIPGFLRQPSPGLLEYYWMAERRDFQHQMEARGLSVSMFEPAWTVIEWEYEKLETG